MRVLIVENVDETPLGQVGRALDEAGASIDWVRAWAGEPLPDGPDGHDAIVVLGGPQNARADDTHPYLPHLAALMRGHADAGKPVLGICLGSQILARALGADNLIGTAPEFGWRQVVPTGAADDDPVLGALDGPFPIFQWHDDTFSLPAGAVRLAGNDATPNQAFRYGRAAYGIQFHFEADTGVVTDWSTRYPDLIEAKDPTWRVRLGEEQAAHGPAADAAGLAIARAWVALIGR